MSLRDTLNDPTTPLLRYDPDVALLEDIYAVECWLRWCQHPQGGRMGFDFALNASDYVNVETGERTLKGSEARRFNRARDRALKVILAQDDDRDPDAVLIACMPDDDDR